MCSGGRYSLHVAKVSEEKKTNNHTLKMHNFSSEFVPVFYATQPIGGDVNTTVLPRSRPTHFHERFITTRIDSINTSARNINMKIYIHAALTTWNK